MRRYRCVRGTLAAGETTERVRFPVAGGLRTSAAVHHARPASVTTVRLLACWSEREPTKARLVAELDLRGRDTFRHWRRLCIRHSWTVPDSWGREQPPPPQHEQDGIAVLDVTSAPAALVAELRQRSWAVLVQTVPRVRLLS